MLFINNVRYHQVRSCHALIKCGAKVDIADQMGTTALHYAAYLGYCNVISLLISKGATPLLRDCQVDITHKYP